MQGAALIAIAALAFAGAAITTGWQDAYPTACPAPDYTIRYLPVPEPEPIYPVPKLTIADFTTPAAEQPEEPSDQMDDPSPARRTHHRYHRRHWRRH